MGHRALVAYERPDGRFDLHYSHWGAARFALADAITARTPYGGADEGAGGADPADPDPAVDPEPIATGLAFDAVAAERVDFQLHEACYRVDPAFGVTAFLPLWFGLAYDAEAVQRSATVGNGALVALRPGEEAADARYLRGWLRGMKAAVGTLCDRWAVTPGEATSLLAERVAGLEADGREVLVAVEEGESG